MEQVALQQPLPLTGWDELQGHESERVRLATAEPFASLLFSGPQGTGKSLLAAWYAANLNCASPRCKAPWSCSCANCRAVLRNTHPDVVWLERQAGKQSLGVGEARDLISQLYLRPYQARQRVCIIPEAERLTEEAQSALLKTLEEPPSDNILILVTHQESRLLPTVLSRCRLHRFLPLDDAALQAWLRGLGCPPDACERHAALAQGCPGRARRLWETPQLSQSQEALLDILSELPGATLGRAVALATRAEGLKAPGHEGRAQLEWVLEAAGAFLRDVMLQSHGARRVVHRHRSADLDRLVACGPVRLKGWLNALQEAREFFTANVNSRVLLQNFFLKLRK